VTFEDAMEDVARGFEVAGVVVLVLGSVTALGRFVFAVGRGRTESAYERLRQGVGRVILLGLEVLIIADIVLTITVDATVESAVTLGLIVLVRTFLSFSLEIELDGAVPWRRGPARQAGFDRPRTTIRADSGTDSGTDSGGGRP
jgi:uncharacterized membrane protein